MAVQVTAINTLTYDPERCIGCGMCSIVCPHGVFEQTNGVASLIAVEDCIECGACMMNCPAGAITVDTGPGCAVALIRAALTGREPSRGSDGCRGSSAENAASSDGCCADSGGSSCC